MSKKTRRLEKEIFKLEEKLKEIENHNKIEKLRCNTKKLDAALKLGITLSIIPTIGTIITISNGWNPYKLNEIEKPAIIQTYVNKEGNIKEKKEYNLENENVIYYYSSWQKTISGNYKRDIYKYIILEDDYKKLQRLINSDIRINDQIIKDLFKVVITGISRETEYKNYITEKELNENEYIEGIFSKIDTNDTLIVTEDFEDHMNTLFDKIIYEFIIILISGMYLSKKKYFNKMFDDLNSKPNIIDTSKIKEEIKLKSLILKK